MKDYSDIINLEKWEPKNHSRMCLENRAAQFSPFAALTGYEDKLKETRKIVDSKKILSEDQKEILDQKLKKIKEHIKEKPRVKITFFVKDLKKDGGFYRTVYSSIEKIDFSKKEIVLLDNKIKIEKIIDIEIIDI